MEEQGSLASVHRTVAAMPQDANRAIPVQVPAGCERHTVLIQNLMRHLPSTRCTVYMYACYGTVRGSGRTYSKDRHGIHSIVE
jgi:hypothetical protein